MVNRYRLPLLLLLFPLSLSSCASAPWTRGDTYRQTAIIALQVADWRQTRRIASEQVPERYTEHPDGSSERLYAYPRFREVNPILGEHPSREKVDAYSAAGIVGNAAISYALSPPYREWWQWLSIIVEGAFVAHNISIGVKF